MKQNENYQVEVEQVIFGQALTRIAVLAKEVQELAKRLRTIAAPDMAQKPVIAKAPLPPAKTGGLSFAGIEGTLKACRRFLQKNINDLPKVYKKTGASPTEAQLRQLFQELAWIETAAGQILEFAMQVTPRSRVGRT